MSSAEGASPVPRLNLDPVLDDDASPYDKRAQMREGLMQRQMDGMPKNLRDIMIQERRDRGREFEQTVVSNISQMLNDSPPDSPVGAYASKVALSDGPVTTSGATNHNTRGC